VRQFARLSRYQQEDCRKNGQATGTAEPTSCHRPHDEMDAFDDTSVALVCGYAEVATLPNHLFRFSNHLLRSIQARCRLCIQCLQNEFI
jgi:hypothetical protein